MAQSDVRLKGFDQFSYDPDALKQVLRSEGREVAKTARRLISRRAISNAGEFPGKRTGLMQKTIRSKISRSGLLVVITHQMKSQQARYPFMLAYGVRKNKVSPRADHILEAQARRRSASTTALRSALHKTIRAV